MSSSTPLPSPNDGVLGSLAALAHQLLGDGLTNLPSWFLDKCVKTAEEIAGAEATLLVRGADSSGVFVEGLDFQNSTGGRYETDSAFYGFIKDELAAPFSQDESPKHRALFLRMPQRQDDPLEARGFFSAVINSLAKDSGADLVTLDIADVANLAEHYARSLKIDEWKQKDGVWPAALCEEHDPDLYDEPGDVPDHTFWIPLRSIVTASHRKSLMSALYPSRQVILHIPGAYTFTKELIGRNILLYLAKIIQDKVSDMAVTLILTDSENSQNSHADPDDILEMTSLGGIGDVFYIFPEESSSLEDLLKSDASRAQHLKYVDQLQKVTRRLKAISRGDEEKEDPLLLPYSELEVLLYSELGGFITEEPSFYLAQCLAAVSDWTDSEQVHHAVRESREIQATLDFWTLEDDDDLYEKRTPKGDRGGNFTSEAQKKAMRKKADPSNKFELHVLDLVVDIGSLEDTWSDIEIDLESKRSIVQMVNLCRASPAGSYGILQRAAAKGAVLYGPPGTGKTHLARVLAKESKSAMIHVSAADILEKYIGESEKFIKALFAIGRKAAPSIIFIDEADALLRVRKSEDRPWQRSMLSQFLQDSDGLKREKNPPFLLLATNNPHELDPAVLRRIPGRLYIGMPSDGARQRLFSLFLRDERLSPALDLRQLAGMTAGYTGSDIFTLCVNAALVCQDEVVMSTDEAGSVKRVLMLSHFKAAIKRTGPTVHATALHKFRRFAHEYHPAAESKIMEEERGDDPDADLLEEEVEMQKRERTVEEAFNGGKRSKKPNGHKHSRSRRNLDDMKYYQPLDSARNQIRLLKITNSGWATGKVECELEIVSLSRYPRYTALSYVWGDMNITEDIIINGTVTPVTRNLARALRTIRQHWSEYFPGRDVNEFRIWADAVCINQNNIAEKNTQIQMMREIYTTAELVIASLDTGDVPNKLTEIALDTFNAMYEVLFTERSTPRLSSKEILSYKWLKSLPSLYQDVDDNDAANVWHAIDFFQTEHAYFRRVWILQEIVMAKELIFVCSSHSIEYERLRSLGFMFISSPMIPMKRPDFIAPRTWDLARKFQAGTGLSTFSIIAAIKEHYRISMSEGNELYDDDIAFTILYTATGLLWLGASNPRDYFYGMLGFTKIDIDVDYNKSVREVYRDFCRYRLKFSGTACRYQQHFLLHFSGVGILGSTIQHDLPSWAPNFDIGPLFLVPENAPDASSAFRQMRKMFAYQVKSTQWVGDAMQAHSRVFTSLEDSEAHIEDDYTLFIPGLLLQRVVRVEKFNHDDEARSKGLSEKFIQYCAEVAGKTGKHRTDKPWLLVLLQSLFNDSRQTVSKACTDEHTREQAFVFFMLLAQWHTRNGVGIQSANADSNPWALPEGTHFDAIYDHFQRLFFPKDYHVQAQGPEQDAFQKIWNIGYHTQPNRPDGSMENFPIVESLVERVRAFSSCPWFETVDGYIGRGPPYMMVGDMVAVVKDCGLPILLRRSADGYSHVGPCWVEGFLDGEAIDFVQDGRSKIEWFEIR